MEFFGKLVGVLVRFIRKFLGIYFEGMFLNLLEVRGGVCRIYKKVMDWWRGFYGGFV